MQKTDVITRAKTAMLTLADIKSVVDAFDRGESNVFDALDAIAIALEAHRAAVSDGKAQPFRRRDAA